MTITVSSSSSTSTAFTCTSGFQSCAASLGGGCCPTNQVCGPETCLPTSTSTRSATTTSDETAAAPVRPTSESEASVASVPSSTPPAACPTGFYMCEAYYKGGCCRVGRDCDSTSCPTVANTNVVAEEDVTIGAAVGGSSAQPRTSVPPQITNAAADAERGSCASGWYSCAADAGGGCCPSGYDCGDSCTRPTSGDTVGKIAPSAAARVEILGWAALAVGSAFGIAMILL